MLKRAAQARDQAPHTLAEKGKLCLHSAEDRRFGKTRQEQRGELLGRLVNRLECWPHVPPQRSFQVDCRGHCEHRITD